jgi:cell fate (sporulation/competence/biofilm development) regulator YmcA (YheA/YmcA/DUF963 family)
MFSRKQLSEAVKELADHLQVVEHIKALQVAQKELADAIKSMGERMHNLEAEMRALKSETKLEALKETQVIVNAVQGGLNQRIEDVAVKVAVMQTHLGSKAIENSPSSIPKLRHNDPTAKGPQF